MNPHLFLNDLEAKPATLRAFADDFDHPWRPSVSRGGWGRCFRLWSSGSGK